MFSYTFAAPVKRRAGPTKKKTEEEEVEEVHELIFSLESHSSKELRHFKFLSLSFMAQLLGSASFVGKVRSLTSSWCSLTRAFCVCEAL